MPKLACLYYNNPVPFSSLTEKKDRPAVYIAQCPYIRVTVQRQNVSTDFVSIVFFTLVSMT